MFLPGAWAQELTSDTFSIGMISVKTNYLNPLWALERDFQSLHSLMYESLVRLNDNYEPEAYLATDWMPSNDCKTWTFKLRDDVYFSDGTQLTAYDVAATVNEILRLAKDETAENHGVYASMRYVVASAQANDALTQDVNALLEKLSALPTVQSDSRDSWYVSQYLPQMMAQSEEKTVGANYNSAAREFNQKLNSTFSGFLAKLMGIRPAEEFASNL